MGRSLSLSLLGPGSSVMVRRLDLVLSNGAGSASKLIWQAGLAQGMPALAAFPTIATGMFKAPSLSPDIWDQRLLLGLS